MVQTPYDDYRDELRRTLTATLSFTAQSLMNPEVWGYDQMPPDYAVDLYQAIKRARDAV